MGSGKRLKYAINKYGIENFTKEILFIFETEDDMNAKERELVTEEFCARKDTYNLCIGGGGGFGYINSNPELVSKRDQKEHKKAGYKAANLATYWVGKVIPEETKRKRSIALKGKQSWLGKKHSAETKQKMSKPKNVGSQNPQFGTMWITNGTDNRRLNKFDLIPDGWCKGRILKP